MKVVLLVSIFTFQPGRSSIVDPEKVEFCTSLDCDENGNRSVCGIKIEGEGFRLKVFQNICKLLKYGCQVDEKDAYGFINMEFCNDKAPNDDDLDNSLPQSNYKDMLPCTDYDCSYPGDAKEVCGIRKFNEGYKIKYFKNKCDLLKYNCENSVEFTVTEMHICTGEGPDSVLEHSNGDKDFRRSDLEKKETEPMMHKNLIVVDGSYFDPNMNATESIENFFAATHVLDLPLMEMGFKERTRRGMHITNLKPIKIFTPWIVKPLNISEDADHQPLLSTCFHKCPKRCPDVYSPVCGVPGLMAQEPSLMFQNHCFMDAAQCKMWTENLSPTSYTSAYIESSFLFCLGDRMNGLYRFLPLLRTLQKMGRLKKKGKFQYVLRSMRNFNPMMSFEPRAQG